MKKILIVGGAGYIGAQMAKYLSRNDYRVVILDNLTTGYRALAKYGELVVGDLADTALLEQLFIRHAFAGVMHFSAYSLVGESVRDPAKYYRNNVACTLNLLDVMLRHDVKRLVFSSTAATFGEPEYTPIDERHPQRPINPYGRSKWMVERILQDYADAYALDSVALRYFNACGADPDGELGECHDPETHLIPLALQAASGRRESITLFGSDYPTPDGTCVRDYIHIHDLCVAHALALQGLNTGQQAGAQAFNLGNGDGFSVKEVIAVAQQVVGRDNCTIKVQYGKRRVGDPAVLVADSTRTQKELGWRPQYTHLPTIIEHAWQWEKKLANIQGIRPEPRASIGSKLKQP